HPGLRNGNRRSPSTAAATVEGQGSQWFTAAARLVRELLRCPDVRVRMSWSRAQALVGTLAGIVTIVGALFSVAPLSQALPSGEVVGTAQDAISHRPVTDATIEVLTAENHLVATLRPDPVGRATQDLKEGAYIVRVSHPRYAADVHRIQVFSR